MKQILSELRDKSITEVKSSYIPTAKNVQVKDFYEHCGFSCVTEEGDGRNE